MNRAALFLKYNILSLFVVFSFSGIASAAEGSSLQAIELEKAVQTALANNQDYKLAVMREKEAGEKVDEAWGQLMPVLESEASATRQHAENGFMSLSDGQNEIRFVQLKFGLNPGIFYNSLRASKEARKAAVEESRRIRSSVEYSVIKGFFDVLLAGEIVRLQEESIGLLNTNLLDVQNMYRTGAVPKFELLQAQVELHKRETMLLDAKTNYSVALDTFNYLLGKDRIECVPDGGILNKDFQSAPAGDGKTDYLLTLALKNRPELIQLEAKRNISRYSKNIQSSYYLWPVISIGGYYGKTQYLPNSVDIGAPAGMGIDLSGISGTDEWQDTWQVRVAATYRWGAIIPADQTRAAEREEKLKLLEAEEELLQLKRLIGISIRSNYSRFITSFLTMKNQKENIAAAEEGMRIARESYRAGIIKNSELLSAELSLTNARTSYINAVYGHYVSLAELKKDTGIDDDKIITEDIK